MEIQQHDGVVVEVAGIPVGLRQALTGGRGVTGGRGRRQGLGLCCPPTPHYILGHGRGGGAALALPPRKGAAREESLLPKAPRRCLPPLGLFLSLSLGAWASWGWCPWPI